ncbi:aldolase, partial [Frankia sp. AiPs1]|nr:aldolase [Frankia sp. AiPs1]
GGALAGHVLRALDAGLLDDPRLAAAGLDRATVARLGGRQEPHGHHANQASPVKPNGERAPH